MAEQFELLVTYLVNEKMSGSSMWPRDVEVAQSKEQAQRTAMKGKCGTAYSKG